MIDEVRDWGQFAALRAGAWLAARAAPAISAAALEQLAVWQWPRAAAGRQGLLYNEWRGGQGSCAGPAVERLRDCGAREIVLTDTVPVPEEKRLPNMTVLSVAPLLAAGIRSVFESGSVSTLLNGLPEDMRPRNIYA